MARIPGPPLKESLPLKAVLRRFVFMAFVGAAVALMLVGKIETVVIEELPGHAAARDELACDHALVRKGGQWVLRRRT